MEEKFFLISDGKAYILDTSNNLEDVSSSIADIENITKQEYIDYGFNDITDITSSHLATLISPVKIVFYKAGVDNTTPPPRLRQEYSLNVGVRTMITKPL